MIHFLISSLLLSLLAFLPMTAAEKEEEFMNTISNYSDLLIANKALFQVVKNNDPGEVEKQLNNGADVDARDSRHAQTPLMIALQRNNLFIVQRLLERKANPNKKNTFHQTPLHYHANSIHNLKDILQTLINAKADLDAQNKYGRTILMNSCEDRDLDKIKLLLELNASMDIKDYKNQTAYNLAERMYEHTIHCKDTKIPAIFKEIMALLTAEHHRRVQQAQSNSLYQSTFALAYRKRLNGFLGDCLPRELVDIEIAQHIAAPPYPLQEIEAGSITTATNIN